jgi:hypothetical protein
MVDFCRYDGQDREIPSPEFRRLIHHFAECFANYLKPHRSLEGALGLKKREGRGAIDGEMQKQIALNYLRLRLSGRLNKLALAELCTMYSKSKASIGAAFRAWAIHAVAVLREERRLAGQMPPWSKEEKAILKRLHPLRDALNELHETSASKSE